MYFELLFDTNIIIQRLRQSKNSSQGTLEFTKFAKYLYLSAISICELFALAGISRDEEKEIKIFISRFKILSVNYDVALCAGMLARTRPGKQRRSDLLIAATALIFNVPIVTNNKKDFYKIPGLKLV